MQHDEELEVEDCKNVAKDSDKFQVLANMLKTACDLAMIPVSNNRKLFSKVTVTGVLVDFNSNCVVKAYKLSLDFISPNKSSLMMCDSAKVKINEAFSSLVNVIS